MDYESVDLRNTYLESGSFVSEIKREGDNVGINFNAPNINFEAQFTFNESSTEGQFWVLPQNKEHNLYFVD